MFALGTAAHVDDDLQQVKFDEIGLEFLFKIKFVEKACDFILGKKSPLL
jgi:hypothetical protein